MQALVRVQARARARRALQTEKIRSQISFRTNADPPTPEKYEQAVHVGVTKSLRSGTLKQNASKSSSVDVVDHNRASSTGWNWLDRWMEERYWDSRESTKKSAIAHPFMDDERNAKILEVDPGKPQINHNRRSNHYHSSSTVTSDRNSHVFGTVPDSPSKDSTTAQRSVPSPSSVDMHQSTSTMRYPLEAEVYNESPHFYSASSRPGSSRRGPFTPSKSECSRSFFLGYSDYPNYMATTESSKAKVRSLSAPKQRPEFEKSSSVRRSLAHSSYAQQALAQRSSSLHAKFTNKAYPGSCRLDRLDIPTS